LLRNTIVWDSRGTALVASPKAVVEYCCVAGGSPWPGAGNINEDPRFVAAGAGDYRLGAGSPCIDRGIFAAAPRDDLEGQPRPCGLGVDMGAHELCDGLPPARPFRRGDADGDGGTDITDAVVILLGLFAGRPPPPCEEAADADDSGLVDLTDAAHLLTYLFRGGAPPPPPFPDCGVDPTRDDLSCESYELCE
jgi:hypothetical protein